jgi:hypothetical protein
MSEMVEKVSDALKRRFRNVVVEAGGIVGPGEVTMPSDDIWFGYARDAIEAMREPTDKMLLAQVSSGQPPPGHFYVIGSHTPFTQGGPLGNWPSEAIYKAMIDAALASSKEEV